MFFFFSIFGDCSTGKGESGRASCGSPRLSSWSSRTGASGGVRTTSSTTRWSPTSYSPRLRSSVAGLLGTMLYIYMCVCVCLVIGCVDTYIDVCMSSRHFPFSRAGCERRRCWWRAAFFGEMGCCVLYNFILWLFYWRGIRFLWGNTGSAEASFSPFLFIVHALTKPGVSETLCHQMHARV